ncbi:MAG: hypothetical protein K0R66_993 [Gammaproteobacteria bacterium]|jgi:hypothetical protein|nr:hypothetical protein [Gammaproteobacteria bacterium]
MNQVSLSKKPFMVFSIISLIGLIYFFWTVASDWNFTVDDAYIVIHYSRNLAEYGYPAWNLAGQHTEGYTSFLGMILMALGIFLHIPVLIWDKSIGILSVLGIVSILAYLAYRETSIAAAIILAGLANFLLFNNNTAVHATAGLETAMYTLFLFVLGSIFYRICCEGEADKRRKYLTAFSLMALLTGLCRPEGNLFVVIFAVAIFFAVPKAQKWQFFNRMLLCYVLPGMVYFAWRYWYYGQLLPLPFYVKVNTAESFPGLHEVLSYIRDYALFYLAAALVYWAAVPKKKAFLAGISIALIIELILAIKTHPMMDYDHRYTYPLIILGLLSAFSVRTINIDRKKTVCIAVAILALVFGFHTYKMRHAVLQWNNTYNSSINSAHIRLGKALAACGDSSSIIALNDAGVIPYFSHWSSIDILGLNNKVIATSRFSDSERAQYVISQHPRVIVLMASSAVQANFYETWELKIYQAALQEGMVHVRTYPYPSGNYYLWVMVYPNDKTILNCLPA